MTAGCEGNYWQDTLCSELRPEPGVLIIFGASGDLARRKLFPALELLFKRGLIASGARIVGCARTKFDDASFRAAVGGDPDFLKLVTYVPLEYAAEDDYRKLAEALHALDAAHGSPLPRTYYLATPAALYDSIVENLGKSGLTAETPHGPWRHVVFEKPFGYDAAGAEELDRMLHRTLTEDQIYRIDHYLGKDTVQNVLLLRFANLLFEPVWNRQYIERVTIDVSEELGIGSRAGYFDRAGQLRDMFQNHMLELLYMVAIECPAAFAAEPLRDEKLKLLRAIRPFDPAHLGNQVARGQYASYRDEPGIAPDSTTETFVAMRLWIDNWRWQGVPFELRAGKKLDARKTEIAIEFKHVPHSIFHPLRACDLGPDRLLLRIQPEEGMGLTIQAKKPGPKLCMGALTLNYFYREAETPDAEPLPAYARLLLDCQLGDQTLFIRSDAIAAAWRLFDPVLETWRTAPDRCPLRGYPDGSAMPELPDYDSR